MHKKTLGTLVAASVISAGAFAASPDTNAVMSLEQLCGHTQLSPADQSDCRREMNAATTENKRTEVRRMFEGKAGLRPGSTTSGAGTTSGSSGAGPGKTGMGDTNVKEPSHAAPSAGDPVGSSESLESASPPAPRTN